MVVSDLMSGLVSCWCLVELIVWIVIVLFSCWVFLLFLLLKWQETSVRRCASANGTSGNKPLRVSGSNSFHAKTFANSFFLINSYSLLRCHRLFPLSISTSSVQDINVAVVIIIITIVIMYVYNILYICMHNKTAIWILLQGFRLQGACPVSSVRWTHRQCTRYKSTT